MFEKILKDQYTLIEQYMVTQYITCYRVILTHYSTCGDTLQGNNILSGLEEDEYAKVVDMLEKAILSTDLALYFQ